MCSSDLRRYRAASPPPPGTPDSRLSQRAPYPWSSPYPYPGGRGQNVGLPNRAFAQPRSVRYGGTADVSSPAITFKCLAEPGILTYAPYLRIDCLPSSNWSNIASWPVVQWALDPPFPTSGVSDANTRPNRLPRYRQVRCGRISHPRKGCKARTLF